MKIITSRGELLRVDRVIPYIEVAVTMNEEYRAYKEPVTTPKQQANALKFIIIKNDNKTGFCLGDEVFVGNLNETQVSTIITELAVDEIVDLRRFEYQSRRDFKPYLIGEQYKPYIIESVGDFPCLINPSGIEDVDVEDDYTDEWDEYDSDEDED